MKSFNRIIQGDCIEEMKKMPDNSVDAIVCDPPYGLGFMGKEWDTMDSSQFGIAGEEGVNDLKIKKNFKILPRIAEGKSLQEFSYKWAVEALRILKPGAYLLAFGGTRTYHRMAVAIEDAGFEIRDCIEWVYGSGFPKSLNIGKAIDKMQGNEREVVGKKDGTYADIRCGSLDASISGERERIEVIRTKGTSQFEGYGTALKPSHEPIVMARKPLSEKTVAENCLKWGTGGINVDGSRVGTEEIKTCGGNSGDNVFGKYNKIEHEPHYGRFPANLIHDGSEEVLKEFEKVGISKSSKLNGSSFKKEDNGNYVSNVYGKYKALETERGFEDSGTPARFFKTCEFTEEDYPPFFYCAKASKGERNEGCEELKEKEWKLQGRVGIDGRERLDGCKSLLKCQGVSKNNHPTVKPIKLMQYLIKLVTPKGGTVLDPFGGSMTTAVACIKSGFNFITIEKEEEYCKIGKARIEYALKQKQNELDNYIK